MKHFNIALAASAFLAAFAVQAYAVTDTPTTTPSPTVTATPTAFAGSAPGTIVLGNADGYGILAGSGITTGNITTLKGYRGSWTTTTDTDDGSLSSSGCTDHAGDAFTQQAKTDLNAAYVDGSTRPATTIPVELGGQTLLPGAYSQTSLQLTSGILTLDGNGDPNAVFTFYTGISTLTTAAGGTFNLTNGTQAKNIFFIVGSSATLGSGSHFIGTIIALQSITSVSGATIEGRLLAINGSVTVDNGNVDTTTSSLVPCVGGPMTSTPSLTLSPTASQSATVSATFSATPSQTGTTNVTSSSTATATSTATPGAASTATNTVTPGTPTVAPTAVGPDAPYFYPSPARGETGAAVYLMKRSGEATLRVYNQTGRLVDTIREDKPAGRQSSLVSVGKFAPGTYYYVVFAKYSNGEDEVQAPRKFVVLH